MIGDGIVLTFLLFLAFWNCTILKVAGVQMLNCYWNDDSNALIGDSMVGVTTTIGCIEKCLNSTITYKYAGTQRTLPKCICGNDIGTLTSNIVECGYPCPTVVSDWCGGDNRMAVYNISGLVLPITLGGTATTYIATSTGDPASTTSLAATTTSSTPSIQIVQTTTNSAVLNTSEKCCCGKYSYLNGMNLTYDELEEILKDDIEASKKELTIDAKSTSSYIRSKTSAYDDRPSSTIVGIFGGAMICIPLLIIVLSDMCNLFKNKKEESK